jgi:hypothetical protein
MKDSVPRLAATIHFYREQEEENSRKLLADSRELLQR